MEYKIVQKPQFTVVGKRRAFKTESANAEIPEFWRELMSSGDNSISGRYGICQTTNGDEFDYYIADDYVAGGPVPDGCETKIIPAGTWAVFPCRGTMPAALQALSARVWNEWLPANKEYALAGNYDIEAYTEPQENPADDYCEIWLPVKKGPAD